MTTMNVTIPRAVAVPRGAAFAAAVFSSVLGWVSRSAASRHERRALASRAAEAAEVRALALQLMKEDRRYAADLLAAADRHELG